MSSTRIGYRELARYKYQLMEPHQHQTELNNLGRVATMDEWVVLESNGVLHTKKGYSWDGPSGPTIDTKNFMRGSLVHDALYQLMRERLVGLEHRKYADGLLRQICRADGMSAIRAWWVYHSVRAFGGSAAEPREVPPNEYAP